MFSGFSAGAADGVRRILRESELCRDVEFTTNPALLPFRDNINVLRRELLRFADTLEASRPP